MEKLAILFSFVRALKKRKKKLALYIPAKVRNPTYLTGKAGKGRKKPERRIKE